MFFSFFSDKTKIGNISLRDNCRAQVCICVGIDGQTKSYGLATYIML